MNKKKNNIFYLEDYRKEEPDKKISLTVSKVDEKVMLQLEQSTDSIILNKDNFNILVKEIKKVMSW